MADFHKATIHVLIPAKGEAEACDYLSEALEGITTDWGYVQSSPLPTPYDMPENYAEGDFLPPTQPAAVPEPDDVPGRKYHFCRICGTREHGSWLNGDILISEQLCFLCNFWQERWENDHHGNGLVVVRNGERLHYSILPDTAPDFPVQGHGGHEWIITYLDGTVVRSKNVWSQGTIPERLWEWFPVNCTMDSAWTWENYGDPYDPEWDQALAEDDPDNRREGRPLDERVLWHIENKNKGA